MGITETAQHRLRVVADFRYVDAVLAEPIDRILQLDELRTAVGSPIGAAREGQQQAVGAHQAVQRMLLAVLVWQGEIGRLLADLGTALKIVVLRRHEIVPEPGVELLAGRHFLQYFVERIGLGLSIHFLAT